MKLNFNYSSYRSCKIQWNLLNVNTSGQKKSVDFIHFQETSPRIEILKTDCLPFVTYNISLCLQCLHLVNHSYSVENLYKLFRQRENHLSLKRGLFKQLDVLHTKTQNMSIYLQFLLYFFSFTLF